MKRALLTTAFREIKRTFSRFLSIFAIVALGTGFFAGVKATSSDMLLTIDNYFDESRLEDFHLISTLGFDDDDIRAVRETEGVETAIPAYTLDVLVQRGTKQAVMRLHSLSKNYLYDPDSLNRPIIMEGRRPLKENECLIDATDDLYKVGDTVTFLSGTDDPLTDSLRVTTYTIVGSVRTPYYIEYARGNTNIGNGKVYSFFYVPEEAFDLPAYTTVYLSAEGAREAQSYSDAYSNIIDTMTERLEALAKVREGARYEAVRTEAQQTLDDAQKELDDAKAEAETELADARAKLDDAQKDLKSGRAEYADGVNTYNTELADARAKLDDGYKERLDGQVKYIDGREEFLAESAKAREKLRVAEAQLAVGAAAYQLGLSAYQDAQSVYSALRAALKANDPEAVGALLSRINAIDSSLGEYFGYYAYAPSAETKAGANAALSAFGSALSSNKAALDAAKKELDAARRQIRDGYNQISEANEELYRAKVDIYQGGRDLIGGEKDYGTAITDGQAELADAAAKLTDGEKELADAEAEYAKAKTDADRKIADAQAKIDDGRKELAALKPTEWYIFDRSGIPANANYYDDSQRIDAVSRVFPVFFFLVAALVCLTTMTRMVEEQRTELGTVKALGYSKGASVQKFFLYSVLASLAGSAFGLAVGYRLFPAIIGSVYNTLYKIPPILTPFHWQEAGFITLAAVLVTTLSALLACYKELAEQPATLMRPKAPKPGRRVLLERVGFIWKRLSFVQKVTVRNLLRYKRRILMTVIGIAGCTALMVAGFGLKYSISSIVTKQFGDIFLYNGMIMLDEDASAEDKTALAATVEAQQNITSSLFVRQSTMTALSGKTEYDAVLFVPEATENIDDFAVLRSRSSHEPIPLGDEGAVVTEKLAKMLSLQVGDTIDLRDGDNRRYQLPVSAITENYFMHYVYITPALYERTFGEAYSCNTLFVRLADTQETEQDRLSITLMENDYVYGVSFNSGVVNSFNDIFRSLDAVVLVLIVSAGLLAFVVLYNLTNINVTERIREIATIKVLGFYDREVSAYIYRENVLLSFIGIAFGLLGGVFLHSYVITTAEIDMVMFGRDLGWYSFVISAALTLLFSGLVNLALHFRLRRVSMVESLKSIE